MTENKVFFLCPLKDKSVTWGLHVPVDSRQTTLVWKQSGNWSPEFNRATLLFFLFQIRWFKPSALRTRICRWLGNSSPSNRRGKTWKPTRTSPSETLEVSASTLTQHRNKRTADLCVKMKANNFLVKMNDWLIERFVAPSLWEGLKHIVTFDQGLCDSLLGSLKSNQNDC